MPRRTTTTDTLEHQAAKDSDLETTPFDGYEMPSHEAKLADLDARSDALNGHGVRPSERCTDIAPDGTSLRGMRCTLREEHDGRHSWENPETSRKSQTSPEISGDLAENPKQPTLPGTPEPEQNEYTVPTESAFGKSGKLLAAPGLKAIAERRIEDDDNLEHLRGVEMRFAWRRRGGTTGGSPRFARIKRPSVWESHFTGGTVDFLLDVSADHVREFRFGDRQIEAAIHEQLSRTERDDDDHDAFRINGPDFSGSISTLDRYGAWRPDLRELRAHVEKLPLEQAIDDADDEEDDAE